MPFVKGQPRPNGSGRRKASGQNGIARLHIEYWPVARLIPYERNPRKNDAAIDRMVASIKEFGFAVPVLAQSTGNVVDGHLRLKAAIKLQMTEVPVIVCDGWTEAQVKAFRLMVNRSVNWADWDLDALSLEFGELKALEFDLTLTGFDSREIDQFTLTANPAEDDVPPVPEVPVTKPGDLWLMGGHRLLCGDATSLEDAATVLGGAKPFLMVTDPPYGVNYDPKARRSLQSLNSHPAQGLVRNDDRADWTDAWRFFPGAIVYVWHAGTKASIVADSIESAGFTIRTQIIWAKSKFVIGRGHYHVQHEPCWYAARETAHWNGDRTQSTLWSVEHLKSETGHSTQKPVEIMRRPILNHTVKGDSVYDPFLGSGTTLIAAELTDRKCYGLEIDPAYCDVIVTRWQNLTGKQATLEGDGRTFDEIKAERLEPVAV